MFQLIGTPGAIACVKGVIHEYAASSRTLPPGQCRLRRPRVSDSTRAKRSNIRLYQDDMPSVGTQPFVGTLQSPVMEDWRNIIARGFADARAGDLVVTDKDDLHTAHDIALEPGTAVMAIGAGVVMTTGAATNYGHAVVIEHKRPDGTRFTSFYGHLGSSGLVGCRAVAGGEVIGVVGERGENGGMNVSPHLHFGTRRGAYSVYSGDIRGYLPTRTFPAGWCNPWLFVLSNATRCSAGALRVGVSGRANRGGGPPAKLYDVHLGAPVLLPQMNPPGADDQEVPITTNGRLMSMLTPRTVSPTEYDQLYVYDRGKEEDEATPLSTTLRNFLEASISANGQFVAYTVTGPLRNNVVNLYDRLKTKEPVDSLVEAQDALSGAVATYPSVSADGQLVAFGFARDNGYFSARVFDRKKRLLYELPGPAEALSVEYPVISADGRYLAVWRDSPLTGKSSILLYDLGTRTRVPMPALDADARALTSPAISADGSVLAFVVRSTGEVLLYDRAADQTFETSALAPTSAPAPRLTLQCWPPIGAECLR